MIRRNRTGSALRRAGLVALTLAIGLAAGAAQAATPSQWVKSFWPTAKAAGVSEATYNRALGDFTPDPDVIKRANNQAEFKTAVWDYLDMMVSEQRLANGKAALAAHASILEAVERKYGVDRYVVLAIWGVESSYGSIFDNPKLVKGTIRSLATLAYQGGRLQKFGRTQLIAALKILQRGDIHPGGMVGSWAGAMGHTQFIPTTYNAYAVDFDGDGKRNIWTSHADALGSTAAYLDKMGWRSGETWGYEVVLPKTIGAKSNGKTQSVGAWQKAGVKRISGAAFPRPGDSATLHLPAGASGPAFLLLKNFSVIKRYNASNSYALAVGHLADRLRGGDPIQAKWPGKGPTLSLGEKQKIQAHLKSRGLYDGPIDGEIGSGSRAAIAAYQKQVGLHPDGVGSAKVLQLLESGK